MNYNNLLQESKKAGEINDCSVKAFAVVTGYSYKEAHWEMKKAGRPDRKGLPILLKGRKIYRKEDIPDYNERMIQVLKRKGFRVRKVECNSKTVRTLGRNIKRNGNFLVFVRGHVLAIKDKKVIDWTEGRCHRIQSVWQVAK
jgi:hypothetical protein